MNHHDWFNFCMELQIHAFSNSTFVFPYHCQQRNRNHEGFNMGDLEKDDNVDVPKIYKCVKDSWNTQLFDGLLSQDTLPLEAKNILKASSNNGFVTFMYNMHNIYNPLSCLSSPMIQQRHNHHNNHHHICYYCSTYCSNHHRCCYYHSHFV